MHGQKKVSPEQLGALQANIVPVLSIALTLRKDFTFNCAAAADKNSCFRNPQQETSKEIKSNKTPRHKRTPQLPKLHRNRCRGFSKVNAADRLPATHPPVPSRAPPRFTAGDEIDASRCPAISPRRVPAPALRARGGCRASRRRVRLPQLHRF